MKQSELSKIIAECISEEMPRALNESRVIREYFAKEMHPFVQANLRKISEINRKETLKCIKECGGVSNISRMAANSISINEIKMINKNATNKDMYKLSECAIYDAFFTGKKSLNESIDRQFLKEEILNEIGFGFLGKLFGKQAGKQAGKQIEKQTAKEIEKQVLKHSAADAARQQAKTSSKGLFGKVGGWLGNKAGKAEAQAATKMTTHELNQSKNLFSLLTKAEKGPLSKAQISQVEKMVAEMQGKGLIPKAFKVDKATGKVFKMGKGGKKIFLNAGKLNEKLAARSAAAAKLTRKATAKSIARKVGAGAAAVGLGKLAYDKITGAGATSDDGGSDNGGFPNGGWDPGDNQGGNEGGGQGGNEGGGQGGNEGGGQGGNEGNNGGNQGGNQEGQEQGQAGNENITEPKPVDFSWGDARTQRIMRDWINNPNRRPSQAALRHIERDAKNKHMQVPYEIVDLNGNVVSGDPTMLQQKQGGLTVRQRMQESIRRIIREEINKRIRK